MAQIYHILGIAIFLTLFRIFLNFALLKVSIHVSTLHRCVQHVTCTSVSMHVNLYLYVCVSASTCVCTCTVCLYLHVDRISSRVTCTINEYITYMYMSHLRQLIFIFSFASGVFLSFFLFFFPYLVPDF